jgi:membrane protein implicated in regulation of membrane protease activity
MTMILLALAAYLACGFLFAVPFVLAGVKGIDAHAAHGSWAFRILIFPGTIFLWPLLAKRWFSGTGEPPEEHNAHRRAAKEAA